MKLLQGEVFDRGDVKVLDAMRDYIEAVEKSETHLLKGQMTDIRIGTSLEEELLTSSSAD
jgi:hypothetical protein